MRAAWLLAYAVVTFLSFPHPVGESVLDLGVAAVWFGPAFLLLAVRGAAPGRALLLGFAGGLLAHAAVLHWIYVVTVRYGHAPVLVGVAAPFALAAYIALFTASFAAGAAWLARVRRASPLALAMLWTALDQGRSVLFTGFPWATLGYAQHGNPLLMGLAPWTGVYGLSFFSVLVATLALGGRGLPFEAQGGRRSRGVALLVALALLLLAGAERLAPRPPPQGSVRVAVLQGNIEQGAKWSMQWRERTLSIYEALTREAAEAGAEIVVWPETAVPGSPDGEPELAERLGHLARETGTVLVVGGVGLDLDGSAAELRDAPPRLFDSAFLLDAHGQAIDRYDKSHLVPFGEYLPLRALLGSFIRAVATGSAGRDVSAGATPRAVRLPLRGRAGSGGQEATVTAGVPICYELLFPDLVRRFVGDGAEILLAMTNDAWYGRTGAPYQFLAMTAMRSAETGVWTARAANTGVSAVIDDRGRVLEQTRIFERTLRIAEIPRLPPDRGTTFYVRHGDVFAKACWLGVMLLAFRAVRGRPRPGDGEPTT